MNMAHKLCKSGVFSAMPVNHTQYHHVILPLHMLELITGQGR